MANYETSTSRRAGKVAGIPVAVQGEQHTSQQHSQYTAASEEGKHHIGRKTVQMQRAINDLCWTSNTGDCFACAATAVPRAVNTFWCRSLHLTTGMHIL
jgi:hypothetical protein